MSVLKVANVHLETTGTNRIDYISDGFTRIISGGTGGIVINVGGTDKINVGSNTVITGNLLLNSKNVDALISATSPAFDKANSANIVAVSAFDKANTGLANSSGTFSGDLTVTGSVNVRSGIISTANNTVGSAGQALLSTGSGTFWSAFSSLLNVQSLTSGTTYTKTTNTNKIIAIGTGGGNTFGAGGTFIKFLDVSANTTIPYTIGAYGAATGGSTTFGTSGMYGKAGGAVTATISSLSGAAGGGTSSNGTMNITGGNGSRVTPFSGCQPSDSFVKGASFFGTGPAYGAQADGVLLIFEFA